MPPAFAASFVFPGRAIEHRRKSARLRGVPCTLHKLAKLLTREFVLIAIARPMAKA
jgi:hypothetical protein